MSDVVQAPVTPGLTAFSAGDGSGRPLFRIEQGIPSKHAREHASELLGSVRRLTFLGVMESDTDLAWAGYYLAGMAKALLDDAELGMNQD